MLLITEEVVKVAIWNLASKEILEFFLKRNPMLLIIKEVIKVAA